MGDNSEGRDEIMARVLTATAAAHTELSSRHASGVCSFVDEHGQFSCNAPTVGTGGPHAELFFGDVECAEHARMTELALLTEDQADDASGKERP